MPPGAERESLLAYLERRHAAVVLADTVDQFLATRVEEACSLGVLDFGSRAQAENEQSYPVDRRDAIRRLKERWPRMQLVLWLDREDAADAADMNASGIRNIFLKPIRTEALDGLLQAAGRSVVQHAREPMSRDKLMELARGRELEHTDRSIDVQVSRLRKLLGEDPQQPRFIQTVWGFGYVFVPDGLPAK